MRYLGLIFLGLTALLGASFAIINARSVPFNYYFGSQEIPLSILLVLTLIIGVLLGMSFMFPLIFRLKLEIRRLRRGIK